MNIVVDVIFVLFLALMFFFGFRRGFLTKAWWLLDIGLIEGDESEYGLFVKTVDGVTKDYDTDGQYWSFYIDGEYAMSGVDSTDIVAGSSYEFRVENA